MRFAIAALVSIALSCTAQTRPAIIGVSHIAVYASDAAAAGHFYAQQLGLRKAPDPERADGACYYVNREQYVEVLPLPAGAGDNRLDHIAWMTRDADALRRYLGSHAITIPDTIQHGSDGSLWFEVTDPEANKVEFVQPPAALLTESAERLTVAGADPIGRRMIHVGMVVHDRAKEDTFYRDILGFRPYWFGGMHEDRPQWVSQQVPDGRDWLEYMLPTQSDPSPLPQKTMGVMNHFSIAVANMEETVTTLYSGDRLGDTPARPQIGRDGKWQFNLYDPDGTRAELMEYSAAAKPCCSEFTAADPTPTGQP
ncbi:MAG TPA: VOC family protein [Acidobacteriaceae bacterium]|jgi:catechol 2,3-dioxygenase-like lactoylglutathione lyase family enzyme|nr:VOC family protein [Acidobacteriaceae bacterium]